MEKSYKTINKKYWVQFGVKNYLIDHILCQIFKIALSIWSNHETMVDNRPIRIYVNKMENRTTFRIKTGYYLELLMLETIKLLGSYKSKIPKDENDENVTHLVSN